MLKKWIDGLTAQQKRELAASVGITQHLLLTKLETCPFDLRVSQMWAVIQYAEKMGLKLAPEDFR